MYFAIRDDDISYFTKPEELDQAYDFLKEMGLEGPVSFSLVPYTVPNHHENVFPYGKGHPWGYYLLGDNPDLVGYLKEKYKEGKADFLLHGCSHEYKKVRGRWMPEMLWKDESRLKKELKEGKDYLEDLLNIRLQVFVAPGNKIGPDGIAAIEKLEMDYSGILRLFDRRPSPRYAHHFLHRWSYRLAKGLPLPQAMDFGGHTERVAYMLEDEEKMHLAYDACKSRNVPFQFYVHYWQINRSPEMKHRLKNLVEYLIADGAQLISVNRCFRRSTR